MKSFIILTICLTTVFSISIPHPGFPEEDLNRGRIINGQLAKYGEAPYIVSMTNTPDGSHFCAGSILNEKWIITAAHCLANFDETLYIHAGLHNRNNKNDGQTVRVSKKFVHEKYIGQVAPYDIALLYLEVGLNLTNHIQSIELPTSNLQQTGDCILYGWGRDNSGWLPNILRTVTTNLLSYGECAMQLPYGAPIHLTNICSGSRNQQISACNGDSGGPLIQKVGDKTVLVGIVSWGYIPCGQMNYPSVYTHTGAHLEWIKDKQTFK